MVLDSGVNTLWATVTDAADQDSPNSDSVSVEVVVLPPLKSVSRHPFPVGLGQDLIFNATARGGLPTANPGPTNFVGGELYTQSGTENLLFSSSNPTDPTSLWTVTRQVDVSLGNAEYEVPITGADTDGNSSTSFIGVWIDITSPGTPLFVAPHLDQPVNQTSYSLKGQADPRSWVTVKVGNTSYPPLRAGNVLGVWEIQVNLTDGPNAITLQAHDDAGNSSPWSDILTLTLDRIPPTLSSSSVDPQWQQVGQAVDLNVTASDTSPLYLGDVQAEVSGTQSATRYLLPGAGDSWQESFTGGSEGEYTVDFKVYDQAGNEASASHTLIVDSTLPEASLTLSASGDYGHTEANIVYYGNGDGSFTVTALMTDTLSKLDTVTFPTSTISGNSYDTLNGLETASESHPYSFSAADTFSDTVEVTVFDRAGNNVGKSFVVANDEVGPTVLIDVPPTSGLGVPVSWEGLDLGSGVRNYEVQVQEDGGMWQSWLLDVAYSQATYVGGAGHSYKFQIKATDKINNASAWVESGSVSVEAVTKYYTFGGQKVAMRQGNNVYYLGGDHLGSTSLTTDSTGGVVSEVRYLPYGQVRWSNGTSVTDFGFTSQRNEASFGLLDYNARYYSAVLGRFVSPDTIVPDPGSSGGFNRYRYTRNNPLKYTDPSGHCPPSVCNGIDLEMDPYYKFGSEDFRRQELSQYAQFLHTNSGISDLEAMARVFEYAAFMHPPIGNEYSMQARAGFIDDIGSFYTGVGNKPISEEIMAQLGLGEYNRLYEKRDWHPGQTGFAWKYRDPGQGGDQPHHFYYFVQVGFYDSSGASALGNLLHETILVAPGHSQGRSLQDMTLGQTGGKMGHQIAQGGLPLYATGEWARDTLESTGPVGQSFISSLFYFNLFGSQYSGMTHLQ